MTRALTLLALLVGLLSPVVYFLEQRLESFYIFRPEQLHDLARRGIAAHGNDTRSVVRYIVDELHGDAAAGPHVNLDEEWIFNNAGGAMGAMYLIHASAFGIFFFFWSSFFLLPRPPFPLSVPSQPCMALLCSAVPHCAVPY